MVKTEVGQELICMTVESFHFGGCELQLLSQFKALREAGINVIVLHSQAKGAGKFLPDISDRFFYIPPLFRKLRLIPLYLAWLFRWKLGYYPTLFHCHAVSFFSEQIFWFSHRNNIPAILKVTTEKEIDQLKRTIETRPTLWGLARELMGKKSWLQNRLQIESFLFGKNRYKTYSNVKGFLALNENIREELEKFPLEEKEIIRIHNGVDTNRFHPISEEKKRALKKELKLPSDKRFITAMSRFAKTKRVEDLILAWSKIFEQFPNNILLLVGDGSEKGRYEDLVLELKLEKTVIFAGFQRQSEKYLQVSDIFVFPSELEGLSNALLEAMSTALPIAASSILSVRSLIDPFQTGLLFPTGEIDALVNSLIYLLENPLEAQKIGLAAREKAVASYSIDMLMPKMVALYQNLSRPFC